MSQDQNEQHARQVDAWIERTAKDMAPDQLVSLFAAAIQALQKRTLIMLSEVTLMVVFDRALYKSQQEFPVLLDMKIEPKGISLDGDLSRIRQKTSAEITEAFRFFLIELLTIFGNITAGILTNPLYAELCKVTAESIRPEKRLQNIKHSKGRSDRGET